MPLSLSLSPSLWWSLLCGLCYGFVLLPTVVQSQSLNFSLSLKDGVTTPFNVSLTSPSLLAEFSVVAGSGSPSSFLVQPSFLSFPGEVLANSFSAGAQLLIRFSPPLTNLTFLFGSFDNGTVSVVLSRSGVFLRNLTFAPSYVPDYEDFEGSATIGGATFDSVVLVACGWPTSPRAPSPAWRPPVWAILNSSAFAVAPSKCTDSPERCTRSSPTR
jgi:hypothetical protein